MTGDFTRKWRLKDEGKLWLRYDVKFYQDSGENHRQIGLVGTEEKRGHDDMFKMLTKYDKLCCFMAASSNGGDDTKASRGIVQGHAYSIISVKKSHGFKLLCLRNPWGETEWTGDWGDDSDLWVKHPKVAKDLNFVKGEDGVFWIGWDDFRQMFKSVDLLDRTTGLRDLTLTVQEGQGLYSGACRGCLSGCFSYYCGFQGCLKMCCGRKSSDQTVELTFCEKHFGCCCGY